MVNSLIKDLARSNGSASRSQHYPAKQMCHCPKIPAELSQTFRFFNGPDLQSGNPRPSSWANVNEKERTLVSTTLNNIMMSKDESVREGKIIFVGMHKRQK